MGIFQMASGMVNLRPESRFRGFADCTTLLTCARGSPSPSQKVFHRAPCQTSVGTFVLVSLLREKYFSQIPFSQGVASLGFFAEDSFRSCFCQLSPGIAPSAQAFLSSFGACRAGLRGRVSLPHNASNCAGYESDHP